MSNSKCMKNSLGSLLILCFSILLCSCIKEYDSVYVETGEPILIVNGQICSNSVCEFILRSTIGLNQTSEDALYQTVNGAVIEVRSSDGERFEAYTDILSPGHYFVPVGQLNPNVSYYLYIECLLRNRLEQFQSEPLRPLDSPSISEIEYEVHKQDSLISFYITSEPTREEIYYYWDYEECWEIYTPLRCDWEYVYSKDTIIKSSVPLYHGWAEKNRHNIVVGTNRDYVDGKMPRQLLYSVSISNDRFQTRYRTKVRQMSISKEEYEYYLTLKKQTDEMGGIFTPMPSDLPSNIYGLSGNRAIGYIGVRNHVGESVLYVKGGENVGYRKYRPIQTPDPKTIDNCTYQEIFQMGFRICQYNPNIEETPWTKKVQWAKRWCVDCTDPLWSASTKRPSYWEDEQ